MKIKDRSFLSQENAIGEAHFFQEWEERPPNCRPKSFVIGH
ncbi:MAG: hypothetical protein AB1589_15930 [Cyanobacteriota bacterium]